MYVPNDDTAPFQIAYLNSPVETVHGGPGLRRARHEGRIVGIIAESAYSRNEAALLLGGLRGDAGKLLRQSEFDGTPNAL